MEMIARSQPCRTNRWCGYLFAALIGLFALWVRILIGDALIGFPFLTFFLATVLAAFVGGTGPGIFAAILTGLLAWQFLFAPSGLLASSRDFAWIAIGIYWLSTGAFITIIHSLISAYEAQLRSEAELRALNAELEQRVAERTNDLTEALARRASAEDRLSESEELYRNIIELSTQIAWSADADGRTLSLGGRWMEKTGVSVADSLGDRWIEFVHPDDRAQTLVAWRQSVANQHQFDCECRLRSPDGEYWWCRSRASPRIEKDGRIIRWYGTLEDIDAHRRATERLRQVQAELIHVSRLSAMGALASTIAHELNQPLTAVINYVRGSRRILADLGGEEIDRVRDALAEVDRCAVHASEVVRRLRDLVTRGDVRRRPEPLPKLIREACTVAMVDAATLGVRYRLDLDDDAATVLVDRIQIEQVLINLLRNAIDAVREMNVRDIVITTSPHSDQFHEVAVRDSGPGIEAAAAQRLFEPFNTTKRDGMGIGLSISRTIIEAHGGRIWNEPAEGGGTLFKFTLART